jgi:hypothetical protein
VTMIAFLHRASKTAWNKSLIVNVDALWM